LFQEDDPYFFLASLSVPTAGRFVGIAGALVVLAAGFFGATGALVIFDTGFFAAAIVGSLE
jgi:hypothetical protein